MRSLTFAAALALSPMAVHAAAPVADPAEAEIRAVMLDSAQGGMRAIWTASWRSMRPTRCSSPARGWSRESPLLPIIIARASPMVRTVRGKLRFDFLDLKRIGDRRILFARWNLSGGAKTESGMTTLVFERRADGWKIVADHSS